MQPKLLRTSTLAIEGALKISQAIKIPMLLQLDEMQQLLDFLKAEFETLAFYNTYGVVKKDGGILSPDEFGQFYGDYVQLLQEGKIPTLSKFHPAFSSALSVTPEIFYEIDIEGHSRIIKPNRPPIQLQPHQIVYSQDSGTIYSMAYSENSITFGVQLSYPNLYQDPRTHEVMDVNESSFFPNSFLFKKIRHWVRDNTVPTPFIVDGKKINLPIRLGKGCFSWINKHPQLTQQNLYVNSRNS